MQPSGEPVLGCLEAQSQVELSDTPIQSEGVDPLPMEVLSHSFDDGDTLQFPPLVFFPRKQHFPRMSPLEGLFLHLWEHRRWPLKEHLVRHARQDLLEQC